MTKTSDAARELAKWLSEVNTSGRSLGSWRKIADRYTLNPDGSYLVTPGTLCTIAKRGGDWWPKDRKILVALRLVDPPKPPDEHTVLFRKAMRKMVRDMKHPEKYTEPDPPKDEKVLNALRKQG